LANRSVNGLAGGRPARRRGRRAGGNDNLHTMFAQDSDKFAIASMVRNLLHRCTGAHTRVVKIYIHVCICIYIYIYVYVHIYTYVYIYISIHICMCMCMYVYICLCMHVYIYIYVLVYMYMYMYIYESIYNFVESMDAFTGVVEHHACPGVYVRQML